MRVSTENGGSASGVSVILTAQPSSQKPVFTSGCAKGGGTATCTVGSVSDKTPASLGGQIPVAASATSVTSVRLIATAGIATTAKWTPPAAAETVAVTSAPAKSSTGATPQPALPALPLGPIPNLNNISSQLINPGNAAGLFPAISPSASPGASAGASAPSGRQNRAPVTASSPLAFAQQGLTGQLAGLVALAVAVLLTVTRLSLHKRFRSRKQGS